MGASQTILVDYLMYSQKHSHCPSLPVMSSWPSCWVYWERRGRNIQETEPAPLLCSREVRRRKPRSWKEAHKEEEINSSKLSVSLIVETYGANPRPICARYTRGSVCILGRFVCYFPLLSSAFQSVKENSKLLCRGPSLNIMGWERKLLEQRLEETCLLRQKMAWGA